VNQVGCDVAKGSLSNGPLYFICPGCKKTIATAVLHKKII